MSDAQPSPSGSSSAREGSLEAALVKIRDGSDTPADIKAIASEALGAPGAAAASPMAARRTGNSGQIG